MTRNNIPPPILLSSSLSVFDRFRLVALLTPIPILVSLFALWRNSSSTNNNGSSSSSSSSKSVLFSNTSTKNKTDDTLNVRPLQLEGHCVSVRIRGGGDTLFTLKEAFPPILNTDPTAIITPEEEILRIGLVFVETPERFFTLKNGAFHLFHFLEFLIVAFASLSKITTTTKTNNNKYHQSYRVEWIYVPPMTPNEICGTANGINCQIGKLAFQNNRLKVYGLDANDDMTQRARPSYRGIHPKRTTTTKLNNTDLNNNMALNPPHNLWNDTTRRIQHNRQMKQTADVALFIHRVSCKDLDRHSTNKLIAPFIEDFPYQQWHENIWSNLFAAAKTTTNPQPQKKEDEQPPLPSPSPSPPATIEQQTQSQQSQQSQQQQRRTTIKVGYLDRQSTTRRLPAPFHEWLIYYFSKHPKIEFHHFEHMEQEKPLDQLRQVAMCDLLVGVHGNGLSHQLWMRPNRYVIELFWNSPFKFDYSTLSELMRHSYLAIFNGVPVDPKRIANHDASLRNFSMTFEEIIYNKVNNTADGYGNTSDSKKKKKKPIVVKRTNETSEQSHQRVKIGFYAIQNFTEKAIGQLLI